MKILITGMNKNQCTENFFLQQQLKVVPSHYSLVNCLRDMDNEVEQREIEIGEDLDVYDKVIVFLAAPSQMVTTRLFEGLYVISKRKDCIIAFDDWQADEIYKSFSKLDENEMCRDFCLNTNKKTKDEIIKNIKIFLDGVEQINKKENRILISAFKGGNLDKIIKCENVFSYNPNPYHLNITPKKVEYEHKLKKFNFASLVQSQTISWLKKQYVQNWEVEYFGNKKLNQRRLIEEEMCDVYSEQWGCLMPGYRHSGSGWWRARPLQVAFANSIIVGDKKELMIYYGNDKVSDIKAYELEDMSFDELINIAEKQKELILKNHPLDKEIQKNELKIALNI